MEWSSNGTKRCAGCGEVKSHESFGKHRRRGRVEVLPRCRPCESEQDAVRCARKPKRPRQPPRSAEWIAAGARPCTACGNTKPFTEFYVHSGSTTGRGSRCKECRLETMRASYWSEREKNLARQAEARARRRAQRPPPPPSPTERPCGKCGTVTPVADFARGFTCRSCQRAYQREQYRQNREARLAKDATYRAQPHVRERARRAAKAWREANPERAASAVKAWRERNPERHRELSRESKERRKRGYDRTTVRYARVLANDPCAYCGGVADEIDHIEPVVDGGSVLWENLTPACRSCNARKRSRPLLRFLLDC